MYFYARGEPFSLCENDIAPTHSYQTANAFMPNRHRRKNSIRRPAWDYRTPGYYFITICTHQRGHLFEDITINQIVESIILALSTYDSCNHVTLDRWVVMPNHIHLLVYLDDTIEYQTIPFSNKNLMSRSVGALVATLKGKVTREIRESQPEIIVWQRGYWDRIVRDEQELNRIREYIRLNPERWADDHENLDRLLDKMDYHS